MRFSGGGCALSRYDLGVIVGLSALKMNIGYLEW
jgi:hypothetical protein